jgi:hypothetical protein
VDDLELMQREIRVLFHHAVVFALYTVRNAVVYKSEIVENDNNDFLQSNFRSW